MEFEERFRRLDESVWTPAYLPAWSSRAAAAAAYAVSDEGLHLTIPAEHPVWCPDRHDPPLRVSAVQSANWSGPVGSTGGQQPFRTGLTVTEQQPATWGFTPHFGRVEVTCRAQINHRSMFSAWMIGLEDAPERCGEICLVEVFGDTIEAGPDGSATAAMGAGIHAFRDPELQEEFAAPRRALNVAGWHSYAVDWRPGRVEFFIDGKPTHALNQAPDYPMQLILAVFDFPDRARAGESETVPELVIGQVLGDAVSGSV